MNAITTSVFELFRIGPGPSSSHTIGPMRAGHDFLQTIQSLSEDILSRAKAIEVRLYGSLSATSKGHGTDRAVLAGLLGHKPETCPDDFLNGLLQEADESYEINITKKTARMMEINIIFDSVLHNFPYSNTLIVRLIGKDGVVYEKEYYSLGGGFLQWKGWKEPERGAPVYAYENMAQIKELLTRHNLRLHELILENEKAITGMNEVEIYKRVDDILNVMEEAVERGIKTEGLLPGPIGLHRKAPSLFMRSREMPHILDRYMTLLSAYAMAVSEENAAGHRIVTAPTAGSAGVIPSILYVMKHHQHLSNQPIRDGFLAAAVVGFLAKHNASISGADVGCQGEIGVAASMAAAMLAYANGYNFQIAENAAESALEHHLGLTCDPVGGYVQIPCIERNAMGAVKAYNAFLIASAEVSEWHMVDLDRVIRVMAETGRDMSMKYKETSQGGLAVSMPQC